MKGKGQFVHTGNPNILFNIIGVMSDLLYIFAVFKNHIAMKKIKSYTKVHFRNSYSSSEVLYDVRNLSSSEYFYLRSVLNYLRFHNDRYPKHILRSDDSLIFYDKLVMPFSPELICSLSSALSSLKN